VSPPSLASRFSHRGILGALALAALLASAWSTPAPSRALTIDHEQRVLRAAMPELRRCAAHLAPYTRLRVTLRIEIAADGRVEGVGVDGGARRFRDCLRRVAFDLVFPPEPTGQVRRLSYPLFFGTAAYLPGMR